MIVHDWHDVPAPVMAVQYERETTHRMRTLGWDSASAWKTVETARTTWGLPGFVCVSDTQEVHGWTFFMCGDRGLEVGGLVADSCEATAALVKALLARAGSPSRIHGLFYASAPSLMKSLTQHAAPFIRYSYRRRLLHSARRDGVSGEGLDLREWSVTDSVDTARLLHRAYERQGSPFGHDATVSQWSEYLSHMIEHDGCGAFMASLSRSLRVDGALAGVALVSSIGAHSAHLVQLAIDPRNQRGGLGRRLLRTTSSLAAASGFTSLSLLVDEGNQAAFALYASEGFLERGHFVRLGSAFAIDDDRSLHAESKPPHTPRQSAAW